MRTPPGRSRPVALVCAGVAAVLGIGHAAVSAYWAVGGSALLDTVGGEIADLGREGGVAVRLGLVLVVILKLVAAGAPLLVVEGRGGRPARWVAWTAAVVLSAYGVVLTLGGVLVQSGVVQAAADADTRALAWHTWLWDPWFALWGLLALAGLVLERRSRAAVQPGVGPPA